MYSINRGWIAIALLFFSSFSMAANRHYRIIIDAGSSGSRLHLYAYDNHTAFPCIKTLFSINTKPGLSSFAHTPDKAAHSLDGLIDAAQHYLKAHHISAQDTTLSLMGTAGMRLISKKQQQAIYEAIRENIDAHYRFPIDHLETISGQMEGLYGWLDVNYLLGHFKNHTPTVGSIDMGGASTQLVFARSQEEGNRLLSLTINHQIYQIFSKSFIGFGEDQALQQMINYPEAAACFPKEYLYDGKNRGYFNKFSCVAIYRMILQKQAIETQLPSLDDQAFIAYSGIYNIFNFFNADKQPDPAYFDAQVEAICYKTWEQLKKEYKEDVPELYLASNCAHAIYQQELLFNTYHLNASQLTIANRLGGQDIDWTLGALLYELIS